MNIYKVPKSNPIYKDGYHWYFVLDDGIHYTKSRKTARELRYRIQYNIKTFLLFEPDGEIKRKTNKELKKDELKNCLK